MDPLTINRIPDYSYLHNIGRAAGRCAASRPAAEKAIETGLQDFRIIGDRMQSRSAA
jgi:hypothetical protein